MIMAAFEEHFGETSALYELEDSLKPGTRAAGSALISAVQRDISAGIPLSRVLFIKQVTSNPTLSIEDLKVLLENLKLAMVNQIEGNAESSLSYAHAAILCSTEIHSRK
jgi:hypothetical protein